MVETRGFYSPISMNQVFAQKVLELNRHLAAMPERTTDPEALAAFQKEQLAIRNLEHKRQVQSLCRMAQKGRWTL